MNGPAFRTVKLAPGYDLGAFDCGEAAYSEWLTAHAGQAVEAGLSMVYLLLESRPETDDRVVGYFAICPTLVVRDGMPKPLQRKVLRNAPGWLLAKLALDSSLRGDKANQWGWQLLRVALDYPRCRGARCWPDHRGQCRQSRLWLAGMPVMDLSQPEATRHRRFKNVNDSLG